MVSKMSKKIRAFVSHEFLAAMASLAVLQSFSMEWAARQMTITSITRHPVGTIQSVDLAFGAENGLTNKLYVAYGDSDGGIHINGWQHFKYLGEVSSDTNSWHAVVPTSKCCRFFLNVPFQMDTVGVPVKWITSQGNAYIDTGFKLKGGDSILVRFRPEVSEMMSILGTRKNVDSGNIVASYSKNLFSLDYCDGNYATFRLMTGNNSAPANNWYDITISRSERSVRNASGVSIGANTTVCDQDFDTEQNCWLFHASGSPGVSTKATGSISLFRVFRNDECIASYVPYQFNGTYGFVDRTSGRFISATSGSFSGEEDNSVVSPLTSVSDILMKEPGTVAVQARDVSVVSVGRSGSNSHVQLAFGDDNGVVNRLYAAYGDVDCGSNLALWDNVLHICDIYGHMGGYNAVIPSSARFCRFFLFLPFSGENPPVQLQFVSGNGSGCFDTGLTMRGGDELTARVRAIAVPGAIFGSRASNKSASVTNMVFLISNDKKFIADYTNSDVNRHRCQTGISTLNAWYDVLMSPAERSVVNSNNGVVIGMSSEECLDEFETTDSCWLFGASGSPSVTQFFHGDIAYFTATRGNRILASYLPCRMGEEYGFYDFANAEFIAPSSGTFSGEDLVIESTPFAAVTGCVRINLRGFVLQIK